MYQNLGDIIEDLVFFILFLCMLLVYYGALPGKDRISAFTKYKAVTAVFLWIGVLYFGGSLVVWLIK